MRARNRTQAGIEALDIAVLPRAAPLDVGGLGTDSRDPFNDFQITTRLRRGACGPSAQLFCREVAW
jgi:hypothetical protein